MEAKSSKAQMVLNTAMQRIGALHEQGRYQESLNLCLQITGIHPEIGPVWSDAAASCLHLGRWQDVIDYAQTALACGYRNVEPFDALAHAYGELGQWGEMRRYGLQALEMREHLFGGKPVISLPEPLPLLPPPSTQTRQCNIIAFSLFGSDSKYCEPAVLNVQEQRSIYPHWVCRFYVDGSVPKDVIERLRKGGAQIVPVGGMALQWPGPMWRLLALDDPQAHRILFRDADAVISRREATAVEQWVASGKRFHMMRDSCSHTELIHAGLWGVVAGSLPPLDKLMERFLSAPLHSRHFADQYFLRQYVWPYARTSLMQHDSVFGFMDDMPFPDSKKPEGSLVGSTESSRMFTIEVDLPNGLEVTWNLYRVIQKFNGDWVRAKLICAYPAIVKDGTVSAHIPTRYAQWIKQGTASVRLSVPVKLGSE
jgi:hypothetical protein